MKNNFYKVKKKTRLTAIMLAAVIGIGVGLTASAAILLIFKLFLGFFPSLYYYLGCAALGVGVFAFIYFITMPSEKRLAKHLDEEYDMEEKMRTMLALESKDDAFSILQRENANEHLERTKVKFLHKKQIVSMVAAFAVSFATLLSALLVPVRVDAQEPEKPLDEFDKIWIITELNSIIKEVNGSLMTESLKEKVVLEIEGLVTFVEEHEYMSEMKEEAIRVVIDTNSEFRKTNTAEGIGAQLTGSTNGALALLGEGLTTLSGNTVRNALDALLSGVLADSTDRIVAATVSDELSYAMRNADSSNPLTRIMKNLSSAITSYADSGPVSLEDAFSSAASQLSPEIMVQFLNKTIMQSTTSRLCALFGIIQSDLDGETDDPITIEPPKKEDEGSNEDPDDKDEPDKDIGSGGLGSGELIYGSNDMLYDYRTNTYVKFGDLLAEYRAKANEKVNDGKFDEELEKLITSYFQKISESKTED